MNPYWPLVLPLISTERYTYGQKSENQEGGDVWSIHHGETEEDEDGECEQINRLAAYRGHFGEWSKKHRTYKYC